ncbi:unnamed protein product, partial [Phaeothamnion confervicola]
MADDGGGATAAANNDEDGHIEETKKMLRMRQAFAKALQMVMEDVSPERIAAPFQRLGPKAFRVEALEAAHQLRTSIEAAAIGEFEAICRDTD